MRLNITLFILLIFTGAGIAQKSEAKLKARSDADAHIADLKRTVLIVRVDNALDTALNGDLYSQLKEGYKFSKVLIIDRKDSKLLKTNELSGKLLDLDLNITNQDVSDGYYVLETERVETNAMGGSMEGFALLDSNLNQLTGPFPYYVKRNSFIHKRSNKEMVALLQLQLDKFSGAE